MKGNIGVWIDFEKAVLIALEGDNHSIKTIPSEIESRLRYAGEVKQFGRFGDQFIDHEKSRDHRRVQQVRKFARKVTAYLSGAEEIVVFGPAEMKLSLKKVIENQPILGPRLKGVVTADRMTDNQMVAWVKDYFTD